MTVALAVRRRLSELGLEQRDLARAVNVTESYISQLLTRRKLPPTPGRTKIYGEMEAFLGLPSGMLAGLARAQRAEALRRRLGDAHEPLFPELRELILGRCGRLHRAAVAEVFARQAYGELERLVTHVLQEAATLEGKERASALMSRRSRGGGLEEDRAAARQPGGAGWPTPAREWVSLLDRWIESWDIDLATFDLTVVLKGPGRPGRVRRFGLVEKVPEAPVEEGLVEFLADPLLCDRASEPEVAFLRSLRFDGARPTALYFYRALQLLRDPLHFRSGRPVRAVSRRTRGASKRTGGSEDVGPGTGT